MAQSTYQKIVLVEDLVLTWPSSFNGDPVVNDINDVEVIVPSLTITLPNAILASPGQTFIFNNVSALPFEVLLNDGTTSLTSIDSGEVFQLYLIDASTSNGIWRLITPLGSFNGITEVVAESADSSIIITGSPITPPGGIFDFKLPISLFNLNAVNQTDFLVVTNTNPLTFQTVELVGGENITVTDGNGLGDDPVIDLNTTLTGLTSITVGDMTFSGSTITNNQPNGNILITTNGTGTVQINGITISSGGIISGLNNLLGIAAYVNFTDTIVGMSNQIVVEQDSNVSSITGSGGTYTINFTAPMSDLNYGVILTVGSTGGSLPFISNAYYIVRELTYVTIIVTDASGELVLSAPHGVTCIVIAA